MSGMPSDRAVKRYVGSWAEWMDSVGVSWEDLEQMEKEGYDFDEYEFELENCQHCPDQDTCVIEPEEREDECHFIRPSSQEATHQSLESKAKGGIS